MRTTTTYHFDGPSITEVRGGKCPTCGKPVTRRQTFSGTVNPFNKNPDGSVKTWDQVRAVVKARAKAWAPGPEVFEHQRCYDARHAPEPAGYEPVPEDVMAKADRERIKIRRWLDWTDSTGLPITATPDWGYGGSVSAGVRPHARMIVALSDVLGVTEVALRRSEGYLGVDVTGWIPDGSIKVTASCWIDPKRIERPKGDTMTVDELAAWIESTGQVQYSRRNR